MTFVSEDERKRLQRKVDQRRAGPWMETGKYYVDVSTGWSGVWGGGAQLNDNNERCVGLINHGEPGYPPVSRYCVDKHCVEPDPA